MAMLGYASALMLLLLEAGPGLVLAEDPMPAAQPVPASATSSSAPEATTSRAFLAPTATPQPTTTTAPPTTTMAQPTSTTAQPTTTMLQPTTTTAQPTTTTAQPTTTPSDVKTVGGWTSGTWTTGYWDCCKPSCAWPGKGNTNKPVRSCDARTGEVLFDPNVRSVCQGGAAATCTDHAPFFHKGNLSMGFAAAAVSGNHGLTGDANCGQCFELRFVDRAHDHGLWGGAHRDIVGKSMVVQVTNIGYDVTGEHSFDLQIPGAGQGAFTNGCAAQFAGHSSGDFDCDNNYGGCSGKEGCARLPQALRAACEWRHDWFRWMQGDGKTNNPYVDFRRVRCPEHLTNISGSAPLDDDEFPALDLDSYA